MKDIIKFVQSAVSPTKKKNKTSTVPEILNALPLDSVDGVRHVFDTVTDYLKTAEQEKTNRANIEANKEKALLAIQSQRDLIAKLIDRTFDERGAVLAKQFETLDRALAAGNIEIVQASLSGMVTVIQSSPFKSVQEMQSALGMRDFVVRLE
jgi:hypothetical protein